MTNGPESHIDRPSAHDMLRIDATPFEKAQATVTDEFLVLRGLIRERKGRAKDIQPTEHVIQFSEDTARQRVDAVHAQPPTGFPSSEQTPTNIIVPSPAMSAPKPRTVDRVTGWFRGKTARLGSRVRSQAPTSTHQKTTAKQLIGDIRQRRAELFDEVSDGLQQGARYFTDNAKNAAHSLYLMRPSSNNREARKVRRDDRTVAKLLRRKYPEVMVPYKYKDDDKGAERAKNAQKTFRATSNAVQWPKSKRHWLVEHTPLLGSLIKLPFEMKRWRAHTDRSNRKGKNLDKSEVTKGKEYISDTFKGGIQQGTASKHDYVDSLMREAILMAKRSSRGNKLAAIEKAHRKGAIELYESITGLEVSSKDGEVGKVLEHIDSSMSPEEQRLAVRFASALNPHSVREFKEHVVQCWMAKPHQKQLQAKEYVPRAHMAAGNVSILDPEVVAAYFGVSVEDWRDQIDGGDEIVPLQYVRALGHLMQIDATSLQTLEDVTLPYQARTFGPISDLRDLLNDIKTRPQPEASISLREIAMAYPDYFAPYFIQQLRQLITKSVDARVKKGESFTPHMQQSIVQATVRDSLSSFGKAIPHDLEKALNSIMLGR